MFYYGPHVKTVVLSSHVQCRQSGLYFFKYRPLYTIRSFLVNFIMVYICVIIYRPHHIKGIMSPSY